MSVANSLRVGAAISLAVAVTLVPNTAFAHPRNGRGGDAGWKRYVEGPRGTNVTPVGIVSTSGRVLHARALLHRGRGAATLSRTGADAGPTAIVLDYGKDVGGLPYLVLRAVRGGPTLHVSYSEGGRYANDPQGDTDPTTGIPRPGEDPHRYDDYAPTGPGIIRNAHRGRGALRTHLTDHAGHGEAACGGDSLHGVRRDAGQVPGLVPLQ